MNESVKRWEGRIVHTQVVQIGVVHIEYALTRIQLNSSGSAKAKEEEGNKQVRDKCLHANRDGCNRRSKTIRTRRTRRCF